MKSRRLGRTGLEISPIALGGSPFTYVQESSGWNPRSDEGRRVVYRTINEALDHGVNYLDTAPFYGDGYSETLFGEVMKTRRRDCILASKVWYEESHAGVLASIDQSLKRLETDYIDVMQVHGRMYSQLETVHVENEVLPALVAAREAGKIGHIGITSEEAFCLIPFLSNRDIDVYQVAYNLIYQMPARHFLIEAQKADVGVVAMRAMTSGIFQREMAQLAPGLGKQLNLWEMSLKFVLSDSRISAAIVGARWPEEILENIRTANEWEPPFDFADMPRTTQKILDTEE